MKTAIQNDHRKENSRFWKKILWGKKDNKKKTFECVEPLGVKRRMRYSSSDNSCVVMQLLGSRGEQKKF